MIKYYTAYNPETGEIVGVFTDDGKTVAENTPQYMQVLEGRSDFPDAYIDLDTKAFVEKPPKPSQYHTFNWQTKQWEDLRTIETLRDAKWQQVKAIRDQLEFGGFLWSGHLFDSDQVSQQRIIGAVQLANLDPNYTVVWTLADNTTLNLSNQDILQVGAALAQHVTQLHATGQQLRDQINQATTAAELELIQWPN